MCVDDALLAYENQEAVDNLTARMEAKGILFEVESSVAGHLGVLIDRDDTKGTVTLRQSGSAKRIIEASHLDNDASTFC